LVTKQTSTGLGDMIVQYTTRKLECVHHRLSHLHLATLCKYLERHYSVRIRFSWTVFWLSFTDS